MKHITAWAQEHSVGGGTPFSLYLQRQIKIVLWCTTVFINHGHHVLWEKEEKDHPDCYRVQKPPSVINGVMLVPIGWITGTSVMAPLMLRSTYSFGTTYSAIQLSLLQGSPYLFLEDNSKPRSAAFTTVWLRRRRVQVLEWPVCSPDLSPVKNVRCNVKLKIRKQRHRTVERRTSVIKIPLRTSTISVL